MNYTSVSYPQNLQPMPTHQQASQIYQMLHLLSQSDSSSIKFLYQQSQKINPYTISQLSSNQIFEALNKLSEKNREILLQTISSRKVNQRQIKRENDQMINQKLKK